MDFGSDLRPDIAIYREQRRRYVSAVIIDVD